MKLGKRTARLVREAAVLGFVHGSRWGQANPRVLSAKEQFPRDSEIVADVLWASKSFRDLYPTLCRAEWPTAPEGDQT